MWKLQRKTKKKWGGRAGGEFMKSKGDQLKKGTRVWKEEREQEVRAGE